MSITISSGDRLCLHLNAWSWGVLHFLVEKAQLFPEDVWESARYLGTELDSSQATQLADFLGASVLPALKPGERMFFDGSKTDLPDDGTFFRDAGEQWKNYSLHREVVQDILEFLKTSKGAVSFY